MRDKHCCEHCNKESDTIREVIINLPTDVVKLELCEECIEKVRVTYNDACDKRNEKLLQMVRDAKEREIGYEQIAKMYNAYISVLLNRLGATEGNEVVITGEDIANALSSCLARASYNSDKDEYSLWCTESEKES